MDPVLIDAPSFVAAVRRLASASPDHIYRQTTPDDVQGAVRSAVTNLGGCLYSDLGMEPCILGRAMVECGVEMETLRKADLDCWGGIGDAIGADYITLTNADRVEGIHWVRLTEWLGNVQGAQDSGSPWSAAILRADSYEQAEAERDAEVQA